MTAKKFERHKISSTKPSSIRPISPSGRFEIFLGDAGTISVIELMDLNDSDKIITELNLHLRNRRKPRGTALVLLKYLRHAVSMSKSINAKSLSHFKNYLSEKSNLNLNTKSQIFSEAKNFVKHLIDAEVLIDEVLPRNFDAKKSSITPTPSFADLGRNFIEDDNNFVLADVIEVQQAFEILPTEAKALIVSLQGIDVLHQRSLKKIIEWESDWDNVDSIISNISDENLEKFARIEDFNVAFPKAERTIQEAIGLLYVKFGATPLSVKNWPRGVEDFLRTQNWKASRIKDLLSGKSTSEEDKLLFAQVVSNLTHDQISKYKAMDSFLHLDQERDPRSIELALSVLYSHFGRLLPDSRIWPKGLADYLKTRGWHRSRARESFFPTPKSIAPYITGLLSLIELSPNVDTVSQYAYLDSFRPSENEGEIITFFDKFRGSPLEKKCDAENPIIAACIRHVARMKYLLDQIGPTGKAFLKLEKTPLFLHFMPSAENDGEQRVKVLDVTTVTNVVKGFVVGAKEDTPFLKAIAGQCTGINFRPTCALIMELAGESFSKIQGVLNHAHSSTTRIYTQRLYTQSLLQTKMKNFQQFIVDNAQSMKNSDKLFDASNVGVDQWINCDAQRIWFHDVDVIADWIAWETAIKEAKNELLFSNPHRWEAYWEPRLLKYQNMLTIVSSTDMRNARVLAKKIVLPPLS